MCGINLPTILQPFQKRAQIIDWVPENHLSSFML